MDHRCSSEIDFERKSSRYAISVAEPHQARRDYVAHSNGFGRIGRFGSRDSDTETPAKRDSGFWRCREGFETEIARFEEVTDDFYNGGRSEFPPDGATGYRREIRERDVGSDGAYTEAGAAEAR